MPDNNADRNLLLGLLAHQLDFIHRDQLFEAVTRWVSDKAKPLGQVLVEGQALKQDEWDLLETLVEKHIAKHGNDAKQCLRANVSAPEVRQVLATIADADVHSLVTDLEVTMPVSGESSIANATIADRFDGLRFQILRPHAKGGLGQVFVAQDKELDREVALKEIQLRYADHEISRNRFVIEAEVTGKLEHPGIVPVYGMGRYPDGRPFYAMRFIRGESLLETIEAFHKRGRRQSQSERTVEFRKLLGRFVDVCQAMEYAHHRRVLHRDLKPGNVMLGKYGETLVVDWGLARILDQPELPMDDGTLPIKISSGSNVGLTQAGKALGTPAYMSPEQAEGKLDQLGPASDIYSLGATMYCLLTGSSPVEGEDIGEVLGKVRRCEIRPPRSIDPAIPKPLEAICLKAMSLRPSDRYFSCAELANDVEHWLADEPVSVVEDKLLVRVQRWSRKNPRSVSAIAAAVLVGVIGLTGGLYFVNAERGQTVRERDAKELARSGEEKQRKRAEKGELEALDQKGRAEKNERLANQSAKEASEREEETAAVLEFVEQRVFAAARPEGQGRGMGNTVTLENAIRAATPEIETSFKEQPLIAARLWNTIGISYAYLGQPEIARSLFQRSFDARRHMLGPANRETLVSMNNLANSYSEMGQHTEALRLREETLKLRRKTLGPAHPETLSSMNNLANTYSDLGQQAEAIKLHEEAFQLLRDKLGRDHPETLQSMNNLATALCDMGRNTEARDLLLEARKIEEIKLGADHPQTLITMNNLALNYSKLGQLAEALSLRKDVLKRSKSKLGPSHPSTLMSMNSLALSYANVGKHAEARELYDEAVALRQKAAKENPGDLQNLVSLGGLYCNIGNNEQFTGHVDRAVAQFTKSIAVLQSVLEKQPASLTARQFLCNSHWGRAISLEGSLAYSAADKDWEAALRLCQPNQISGLTADRRKYQQMRKKNAVPSKQGQEGNGRR